jgi:hypothetical protein
VETNRPSRGASKYFDLLCTSDQLCGTTELVPAWAGLTPFKFEKKRILEMKTFEIYSGSRPMLLAALLSALVVGCGGGGDNQVPMAAGAHSKDGGGSGGGSGGGQVTPSHAPVNLGAAGTFAILSKSGVTDVYASAIKGNVGASPITGAAILLTCPEVTGTIYSVDAAGPAPCAVTNATLLTTAVANMQAAYSDIAGRKLPDFTEMGSGEIGGLTLTPGLYKWGTGVLISKNVTLAGGPKDMFIFQVAGTLKQASATRVTLTGGALAKNVVWQVAGATVIGTTAHFEGILLDQTSIAVNTGASVTGRLLAQTAVTLQKNAVTQPAN